MRPRGLFDASVSGSAGTLGLVFAVALAIRFSYVLVVYLVFGSEALLEPDGDKYIRLAANLYERGVIGGRPGTAEVVPDPSFMPLYIAYLAAHIAALGAFKPLFAVMTQGVVDSVTCVLAAATAATLDRRLALPAGLFAALTPTSVVMAGLIYNDSVFTFFCALALLAAVRWLRAPGWGWTLALGLALGLGTLTRAMLAPWVLLLPVMLIALRLWRGGLVGRHGLQALAAVLIGAVLLVPVSLDNHATYGSYKLTSQGGAHFLLWVVPLVQEAKDGTPYVIAAQREHELYRQTSGPDRDRNPFDKSAAMSALALKRVAELGPMAVAKAWAIGAAINVFAPAVTMTPPVARLSRTRFYDTPGDSKLEKIWNFFFRNDNTLYAQLLILGTAGLLLVRALQVYGIVVGLRAGREACLALAVLVAWVAFVLAVNGPIAAPKYRLPIEPAFAVFFALAFDHLRRRFWRQRG